MELRMNRWILALAASCLGFAQPPSDSPGADKPDWAATPDMAVLAVVGFDASGSSLEAEKNARSAAADLLAIHCTSSFTHSIDSGSVLQTESHSFISPGLTRSILEQGQSLDFWRDPSNQGCYCRIRFTMPLAQLGAAETITAATTTEIAAAHQDRKTNEAMPGATDQALAWRIPTDGVTAVGVSPMGDTRGAFVDACDKLVQRVGEWLGSAMLLLDNSSFDTSGEVEEGRVEETLTTLDVLTANRASLEQAARSVAAEFITSEGHTVWPSEYCFDPATCACYCRVRLEVPALFTELARRLEWDWWRRLLALQPDAASMEQLILSKLNSPLRSEVSYKLRRESEKQAQKAAKEAFQKLKHEALEELDKAVNEMSRKMTNETTEEAVKNEFKKHGAESTRPGKAFEKPIEEIKDMNGHLNRSLASQDDPQSPRRKT